MNKAAKNAADRVRVWILSQSPRVVLGTGQEMRRFEEAWRISRDSALSDVDLLEDILRVES